MGFINFSIREYGIYGDFVDKSNSNGTAISLYYVMEGDSIFVYDYDKFYNRVIK